jgi:Uma2 family endonuclease
MVGVPTIDTGPMTVEEFYAFTDTRPDEEKWELIEGEPILNAAPSRLHQRIVKNLILVLGNRERELAASGTVLPGLGVRVSEPIGRSRMLAIPSDYRSLDPQERDASDVIVAFEVLSPSTKRTRSALEADSVDRQGDRAPLARNFIASGRDLSRHRTGLRSRRRSTIRQPSS